MKKLLAVCALALFLPSCSTVVDRYAEKASLDRADVQKVANAVNAAMATEDLDKNGKVNGLVEWVAFLRALVENSR